MLLAGMVVMLVVQPLLGHQSARAGALFDAVFVAICLYVFYVVFEQREPRDRMAARPLAPASRALRLPELHDADQPRILRHQPRRAAPAYSLTWMEVIFGQFYMAVVVAQLVGLKLAQPMKGDGPEST